jgi:hypothetical protein
MTKEHSFVTGRQVNQSIMPTAIMVQFLKD